ncbi:MAG TPA: hypothetical protein PK006_07675 [Saprospiraceae bacterium]|nr:hypothetical protein [Saprospiraceae bacterium]
MNKFLVLILVSFLNIKCNDDCIKRENRFGNFIRYYEKDSTSNYYRVEIVRGFCTYFSEFDSYNSPRAGDNCLRTLNFKMENLINRPIEVKLNLMGFGEKTFTLKAHEEIDIKPLPDYCKSRTWGEFIDIRYQ